MNIRSAFLNTSRAFHSPEGVTSGISASKIAATAQAMADELAEDTTLQADMQAAMDAKDTTAVSALLVYAALEEVIGPDKLDTTPIPGTVIEETLKDGTKVRHNNPDQYVDTDGKKRFWTNDVCDALPIGKQIAAEIAAAKVLQGSDKYNGTLDLNAANARQTTFRRLVRQGFGMHHQKRKALEYSGVEFMFQMDGEKIKRCSRPIVLKDADNNTTFSDYTPAQFLLIDFDLAASTDSPKNAAIKKGTYARLMEVAGRGKAETAPEAVKLKNVADAVASLSMFANYIDDDENYTSMKKRVMRKDDVAKDIVKLAQGVVDMLVGVITADPAFAKEVLGRDVVAARKAG